MSAPKEGAPTMPKERVGYEPHDWWPTREQIGRCLRKHYPVSRLPSRLVTLVGKLEAIEGNQFSPTLVDELDAPLTMPKAGDAAGKPKSLNRRQCSSE